MTTAPDRPHRLTLVQQNDLHAHVEEHWEYFWQEGQPTYRLTGGIARTAAVLKQIREETGGACCLIDGGDAIHGTGPAQWTQGAAIVQGLNTLGIDAMTPGNWEFGFGPSVLFERAGEMNFPLLACNVYDAASGTLCFAPSLVRQAGGLRIGIVGVATPIVTQTMPKPFGAGLRMTDGIKEVRSAVRHLRRVEQVDLVVVSSHMGLPQDMHLAAAVGDIDVLFSAHTHDRMTEPVIVGKTLVLQSGFSGSFLGRLDLVIAQRQVLSYQHTLITLDESVPADGAAQAAVDDALRPFRQRMGEVVGATATALHRMAVLETPMDNLITDAYLELTGADVALSHGWRYGAPVPPGDITMGDLWQIIPTNPQVFTAALSGMEIRDLLEESLESVFAANPMQQKGGYVIRSSGISARVRINNPFGARIQQLEIGGAAWDPQRRYTVASAGAQDVHTDDKQATGVDAIEAICRYLAQHSPVDASCTGAKFVAI